MADPLILGPYERAFALEDHALIGLTGEDRLEWLQGQATNDVRGLDPGTRLSFCFCQPTGQLLAVVDAWAFEDRLVLSTARECVPAVLERVERMTILEDVVARELPLCGVNLPKAPQDDRLLVLPSDRRVSPSWDAWGPLSVVEGLAPDLVAAEASRIAAGIPKWGIDMGPRTLPPELGPAFEARHLSYAKGCYTGQEVLMRMHTRGHTNRTWVGLVADAPLAVGEPVMVQGREVGRVSSSAFWEESAMHIGAATLRNEAVAEGTVVSVNGARAEVRTMPIFGAD